MSWKDVNLFGGGRISRVANVYDIYDHREGNFKIKVLEERSGYIALANIRFFNVDGSVDGEAGSGESELEALEKCLKWVMGRLDELGANPQLDWSDPCEF